MRVVVTGATGNVGTSVIQRLHGEPDVDEIVGLARRLPDLTLPKTTWVQADVATTDLEPLFAGADVVVHLAWAIQPSRDLARLARTNVDGSRRVFEAAVAAKAGALIHASSSGAYSPGPKDRSVGEDWPTDGIPTSFYASHKAQAERMLDSIEQEHREVRVVRLRPGLTFKREAGSEIKRYFAGPLLPKRLIRRGLIPAIPVVEGVRFQVVHAEDVAEAYRLAIVSDVRGAFNVAAEPVLDLRRTAELLHARPIRVSPRLIRGLASLTWKLHLQPTPPGWVDMALAAPVMDITRARTELGWTPKYSAEEALLELLEGLHDAAGMKTPPLDRRPWGRSG
jgi:UDP-glucose 4-epimerase